MRDTNTAQHNGVKANQLQRQPKLVCAVKEKRAAAGERRSVAFGRNYPPFKNLELVLAPIKIASHVFSVSRQNFLGADTKRWGRKGSTRYQWSNCPG